VVEKNGDGDGGRRLFLPGRGAEPLRRHRPPNSAPRGLNVHTGRAGRASSSKSRSAATGVGPRPQRRASRALPRKTRVYTDRHILSRQGDGDKTSWCSASPTTLFEPVWNFNLNRHVQIHRQRDGRNMEVRGDYYDQVLRVLTRHVQNPRRATADHDGDGGARPARRPTCCATKRSRCSTPCRPDPGRGGPNAPWPAGTPDTTRRSGVAAPTTRTPDLRLIQHRSLELAWRGVPFYLRLSGQGRWTTAAQREPADAMPVRCPPPPLDVPAACRRRQCNRLTTRRAARRMGIDLTPRAKSRTTAA